MRILQIIDSLEAGGAERMAVNYANALVTEIEFSGLVATRKQGMLLTQINPKVSYLFLNKKRLLDFGAIFRLRSYVLKNKATHIHAHSTSFFLAFVLKLICPSVKLIWHYHHGNNSTLSKKRVFYFKLIIPFFNGVLVVNQKLKFWIENELNGKNVIYVPNFSVNGLSTFYDTKLRGCENKRIVSLANLRRDKNHFLLIEVAKKLKESHPDWTFHLVGKDFEDAYSHEIKKLIKQYHLEENVFLYGSRQDVTAILAQSDIGILTSVSEGLPVAVLEYGLSQLPIVVTAVGELPNMIENRVNGCIVPTNQVVEFHAAIIELIQEESLRNQLANALHQTITAEYSERIVIEKYINWVQTL